MAGAAATRYAGVAGGMGLKDALGCKVKLCGLKREQDVDAAIAAMPMPLGSSSTFLVRAVASRLNVRLSWLNGCARRPTKPATRSRVRWVCS